jgi:hypothetical protein
MGEESSQPMANREQFTSWQALAESIREELRECAGLMSLLDRQQKAILARDPDVLVGVNESILEQSGQVRAAREDRVTLMASACGGTIPDGFGLRDLAPLMPEVVRPLFEALAREAGTLRKRINHRTEQNHRLLERISGATLELLETASPGTVTRTYGRAGGRRLSSGFTGSMIKTSV